MNFKNIKKLFIIIVTVLSFSVVKATTYYVSNSGSNSNNGTSTGTPWQTMSKVQSVANAGTIVAGDIICFKSGDVFTGSMTITTVYGSDNAHSGTSGNPITITSYGTGNKPEFRYPSGGSTVPENRIVIALVGVDNWNINNILMIQAQIPMIILRLQI